MPGNAYENSILCLEKPQFCHYIKSWLYLFISSKFRINLQEPNVQHLRCIIMLKVEAVLEN